MNRRQLLLGSLMTASLGPLLTACGGGDDTEPKVRLINASMGYSSLDLWVDGSKSATDVLYGSSSSYVTTDNSITTALTVTGSTSYLQSTSRSVSDDTHYALIAYGWSGGIKTALITEEEDAADDSSNVKLLVLNTATDAGSLDVYVTGSDESLDESSPVVSSLAGGSQSSYVELVGNTYRVRITGASDTDSLRLDISDVTLTKGKVYILIITPGTGGVLVHAILTEQASESATSYKNSYARVRAVASVSGNVTTSATAGGVSLLANAASPTVGSYLLVPAGNPSLSVSVAGTTVNSSTLSAEAGADLTVLVYGTSAAPLVTTLTDNNRLPSSSTGVKMRLVHAATELSASTCDLTVDYSAVASGVGYGLASSYSTLTASDSADIAATTAANGTVYSAADVTLAAKGVYTVFIASNSSGTTGILRKER